MDMQISGINAIDKDFAGKVNAIIERNKLSTIRPASCPLNSIENVEILAKVKNIKTLFDNSCLDKNQERLENILTGAQDIQSSIDQYRTQTQENQSESTEVDQSQSQDQTTIDGEQIATVVTGLSNLLQGNSCDSLKEDKTFLNKTSSVISEIATIGLATNSSNGLIVSAGGFALSSILTAIDSIFKKRFDFSEAESRQTFIKLNCAFYDVRRDIQTAGFLDVATEQHGLDLRDAREFTKFLDSEKTRINSEYSNLLGELTSKSLAKNEEKIQRLLSLKDSFQKVLTLINTSAKSTRKDQLELINSLTLEMRSIIEKIDHYFDLDLQHIEVLDNHFIALADRLDYTNLDAFNQLLSMKAEDFFSAYITDLEFHLSRIAGNILAFEEKWTKTNLQNLTINSVEYKTFLADQKKIKDAQEKDINSKISDLTIVISKLERILGRTNYTRGDDGADNIVSVLHDYENIRRQVFGAHGINFLNAMVDWSLNENRSFYQDFNKFQQNYLFQSEDISSFSNYEKRNVCQNAIPLRRRWSFAKNLSEQAYDFIATNVDIFSHSKKMFNGLFDLNNIEDKGRGRLSAKEEILYHEKSAQVAKMVLEGVVVPESAKAALLGRSWLGRAMIELDTTMIEAQKLQRAIETLDCYSVMEMQ